MDRQANTRNRRATTLVLVLILGVVLAVVSLGTAGSRGPGGASERAAPDRGGDDQSFSAILQPDVQTFELLAQRAFEAEVTSEFSGGPPVAANESVSAAPLEVEGTIPDGQSFDLASYFIHRMGHLDAERLLRHVHLNPALRELDGASRARFAALIVDINARLVDVAKHWRLTRIKEMSLCIDVGSAVPLDVPTPSEKELAWLANSLLQSAEVREEGHTLESIMESLRKQPPPNVGIAENHIVHGGRAYSMKQFASLPATDGMFETLRFFAWESFATVHSWFVVEGMGPTHSVIEAAAQRLTSLTAAQYRGG